MYPENYIGVVFLELNEHLLDSGFVSQGFFVRRRDIAASLSGVRIE
jgi:hypothetical protein